MRLSMESEIIAPAEIFARKRRLDAMFNRTSRPNVPSRTEIDSLRAPGPALPASSAFAPPWRDLGLGKFGPFLTSDQKRAIEERQECAIVDVELRAQELAFANMIGNVRRTGVTIPLIKLTVALHFRVPVREMNSICRRPIIVKPRQIAIYLAHEFHKGSLPTLGRKFGNRDHTTVLHAIRKIARAVERDATLHGEIAAIRDKLHPATEAP
jgi:hypothetical protein